MNASPSPLPVFFSFAGLLIGSLLLAALLSPLAFHIVDIYPFHRVFNRLAMASFLVGAFVLARRMRLISRATLGFGAPGAQLLKGGLAGFGAAVLLMAAVFAVLFALGLRTWPAGTGPLSSVLQLLPKALLTGATVGLIEETFFRGAMYSALRRRGGAGPAIALTSLLYAAVHFLGERYRIPAAEVDWSSGLRLLGHYFNAYSRPLEILDAFVALTLVGTLLALAREFTGHIGVCIGLHAGFVAVIVVLRKASTAVADQPASFLVGHFDGVVGWLVAAFAAVAIAALLGWHRARLQARASPH